MLYISTEYYTSPKSINFRRTMDIIITWKLKQWKIIIIMMNDDDYPIDGSYEYS